MGEYDKMLQKEGDGEGGRQKDGVPIDHGWAWVIMAAMFTVNLIGVGYQKAFGILYVEFRRSLGNTASFTSLIEGVRAGVFSLMSLVTLNVLLEYVTVRKLAFAGSLLMSTGILLCGQVRSVQLLLLSHGLVFGVGVALIDGPMMVLLSRYFLRRRPLAIAAAMSGISVGSIAIPPLMRLLLDTYGIRGALLLYSGVALQMVVCSCLFRGTEEYGGRRELPQSEEKENNSALSYEMEVSDNKHTCSDNGRDTAIEVGLSGMEGRSDTGDKEHHPCGEGSNAHPIGHGPEGHDPQKHDDLNRHDPNIRVPQKLDSKKHDLKGHDPKRCDPEEHDPKRIGTKSHNPKSIDPKGQDLKRQDRGRFRACSRLATLLDVYMFRDPLFVMLVAVCGLSYLSIAAAATFLPALAGEMGLTDVEAALMLTVNGGLDVAGRLLAGVLVDRGWVGPDRLLAVYFTLLGTAMQLTWLCAGLPRFLVFVVVYGALGGAYFALAANLVHQFVGAARFPKAYGFVQLFHGGSAAAAYPALGALQDARGTYTVVYHVIGGCLFLAALLLFLEPRCRRCKRSPGDPQSDNQAAAQSGPPEMDSQKL